jgi:hypothetical protein
MRKSPSESQGSIEYDSQLKACLTILEPFSAGDAIYLLSLVCPDSACALQLASGDYTTAQSRRERPARLPARTEESQQAALARLTASLESLPSAQASAFWTDLAIAWITNYPLEGDLDGDLSKEEIDRLASARLRTRLIESILGLY